MNTPSNNPPQPGGISPPAGQAAPRKELTYEEARKNCMTVDEFFDLWHRRIDEDYDRLEKNG